MEERKTISFYRFLTEVLGACGRSVRFVGMTLKDAMKVADDNEKQFVVGDIKQYLPEPKEKRLPCTYGTSPDGCAGCKSEVLREKEYLSLPYATYLKAINRYMGSMPAWNRNSGAVLMETPRARPRKKVAAKKSTKRSK